MPNKNYTDNLDENNQLDKVYIFHVLDMEIVTYKANTKYIINKEQEIQLVCISNNYRDFLRNIKVSELNTCKNGVIIATSKQHMEDIFTDYEPYLTALITETYKQAANILIESIGGNKDNG